jgi:hypothetical protein
MYLRAFLLVLCKFGLATPTVAQFSIAGSIDRQTLNEDRS